MFSFWTWLSDCLKLVLFSKHMLCPKRIWSLIFFSMPVGLFNAPCFSCTTQKSSGAFQIWELTHIWKCLSGLQWPEGCAQQRVCCVLYHITYRKSNVTCSKFSARHSSAVCVCTFAFRERILALIQRTHTWVHSLNWTEMNRTHAVMARVRAPALFVFPLHY